ncbi:MAG: prolipoprotein diacylglyceryl transferase [Gammaproteobacteria bacterium]|nr:prolipoprotein diacylglyceryl transferase [Gammaproteobacteria bacterium]NNC97123.1 prolipoprotein diacylglyceryl transferase [Gammaproteobacteria bacterium]NNM13078.1 prolipoprotein diacylglyceryl transferase [Gammaproteobacteria bacterium]
MFTYPEINPYIFKLGPIGPTWYGLMYVLGFVFAIVFLKRRAKLQAWRGWTSEQAEDMIFYGIWGVILGGRLGYVLFYNTNMLWTDPIGIFKFWEGGMSFHGGLLGVLAMMWLYAKRTQRTFFQVTDFLAPGVAPGLLFGRMGNFINGELWGKPTDSVLGVNYRGQVLHPSQLYEALLEGLVLFIILWWVSRKPTRTRLISGLFLFFYGLFRFMIEFVRVPDSHLGYQMFGWVTRGQQLCFLMVVFGLYLIYTSRNQPLNQVT